MKPLILDYKISRSESDNPIRYIYDVSTSLNVVTINGSSKPYIELDANDIELMTKTKVHRENDDDDFLLELETKTKADRERDDLQGCLLDLSTKTLIARERDDEKKAL